MGASGTFAHVARRARTQLEAACAAWISRSSGGNVLSLTGTDQNYNSFCIH